MLMEPTSPSGMVYPLGVALATEWAAIWPPAPALFSTTTAWPNSLDRASPTVRATMSGPVPAGKPTVSRTGCSGQAAAAVAETASMQAAAISLVVKNGFICLLQVLSGCPGRPACRPVVGLLLVNQKEIEFNPVRVTCARADKQAFVQPHPFWGSGFKARKSAEVDTRRVNRLAPDQSCNVFGRGHTYACVLHVNAITFLGFDDVARVNIGVGGRAHGLEIGTTRQYRALQVRAFHRAAKKRDDTAKT